MVTRKQQLTVDGHRIRISNPDKPGGRFTKVDANFTKSSSEAPEKIQLQFLFPWATVPTVSILN
jgi:hypothetical protein